MTPAERLVALSRLALTMSEDTAAIEEAARVIVEAVKAGGTVYCAGNGGSFAQAQHFAAELTGRYKRERRPVAAVALGSNGAHVTAVANDYGYRLVFAREIEALAREHGDGHAALVCLSTSGRSANVIEAAAVADEMGLDVVAVVGFDAPEWARAGTVVRIPSTDTALIQEGCLSVLHSIAEAIDEAIE